MVNASNAGAGPVRKPGSRTAPLCATLAAAALGILVVQYGNLWSDANAWRQDAHAGSRGPATPADAATTASDVFRAAAQPLEGASDAAAPAAGAAPPDLPDAIASVQAAAKSQALSSHGAPSFEPMMSEASPLGESIKTAQYISSRQQPEISTANPFLTLPREPFPLPKALP